MSERVVHAAGQSCPFLVASMGEQYARTAASLLRRPGEACRLCSDRPRWTGAHPRHCYSRCPDLLRTLGYPSRDADGVPDLPAGALVPLAEATCGTCLDHARSVAPYAPVGQTHGDWLSESA